MPLLTVLGYLECLAYLYAALSATYGSETTLLVAAAVHGSCCLLVVRLAWHQVRTGEGETPSAAPL